MASFRRAAAAAAIALMTITTGVSADHEIKRSGTVGRFNVVDSRQKPGATCASATEFGSSAMRITIRGPRIRAVDRGPGTDHQTVGWQWVVRRKVDGVWKTESQSGVIKAEATDASPAVFDGGSALILYAGVHRFRIRTVLTWHSGPFALTTGRVVRELDFYQLGIAEDADVRGPKGFCTLDDV